MFRSARSCPVAGRGGASALADEVSVLGLPVTCTPASGPMRRHPTPSEVCLGDLGVRYQDRQARLAELGTSAGIPGPGGRPSTSPRRSGRTRGRRRSVLRLRHARRTVVLSGHLRLLDRNGGRGSVPTSPSSPQPAEATSTVSRSRARWPSLSAAKPHLLRPPADCPRPPRQLAPWIFRLHRRRPFREELARFTPGVAWMSSATWTATRSSCGR